jgi:hypothetical protein
MTDERDGVWLHAEHRVTIAELSETCGLSQELLRELVEYGALHPRDPASGDWIFGTECVATLRVAARLASDLELEPPATALVIRFLERIGELEAEVRALHARLSRPLG